MWRILRSFAEDWLVGRTILTSSSADWFAAGVMILLSDLLLLTSSTAVAEIARRRKGGRRWWLERSLGEYRRRDEVSFKRDGDTLRRAIGYASPAKNKKRVYVWFLSCYVVWLLFPQGMRVNYSHTRTTVLFDLFPLKWISWAGV